MKQHTCPKKANRIHSFLHNLSRYHTDLWDFRTYGYHPVWFTQALLQTWRDAK
jgi:hypothetical protein